MIWKIFHGIPSKWKKLRNETQIMKMAVKPNNIQNTNYLF